MDEIQFYCIVCGAGLSARAKSAGGLGDCPRCLKVIPIPSSTTRPGAAASAADYDPEILMMEIKFLCGCCGKKIRVDARSQGQAFDCPVCHGPAKVPDWGGPLPPKPPDERHGCAAVPVVPLSTEECEFLSAPLHERGKAFLTPGDHAPLIQASLLPDRLQDFSSGSREQRLPGAPPAAAIVPHAVFGRSFQPPAAVIGLVVPAGDEAARRVAQTLTEVLTRAGWKVRGVVEDKTLADGARGLTFAAAPTLPLQRVTSTLNALREAGFAANFQIDPDRGTSEALLIVGASAGVEKAHG